MRRIFLSYASIFFFLIYVNTNYSQSFWQKTGSNARKAFEGTKRTSSSVWNQAKRSSRQATEKISSAWNNSKGARQNFINNSKHVAKNTATKTKTAWNNSSVTRQEIANNLKTTAKQTVPYTKQAIKDVKQGWNNPYVK